MSVQEPSRWRQDTPLSFPSPFYRVTSKAIILDDQKRLLVVKNHNGNWELPGGGWEHDESFEDCLAREIQEELGVEVETVGAIYFNYRGHNVSKGFITLRLVAPVKLRSFDFQPGDDIQGTRFVTRDEFLGMDFIANEGEVGQYADKIWPNLALAVDK